MVPVSELQPGAPAAAAGPEQSLLDFSGKPWPLSEEHGFRLILLGARTLVGVLTRSKDAMRGSGSWPYYQEQRRYEGLLALLLGATTLLGAPGLTTRSKDAIRGSWPYY